jgi:hypothetical protein
VFQSRGQRPLNTKEKAKAKLDKVIQKSRVHWYKPIQVAEILHHDRTQSKVDLGNLETYRNRSKDWRNQVTMRLLGRISTSSQRYQDNLFDENATPPSVLETLRDANIASKGAVEAYIYTKFKDRQLVIRKLSDYLNSRSEKEFRLSEFIQKFEKEPGLRRSIDKAYEIVVYALFETLVEVLDANVTLSVGEDKKPIVEEFDEFSRIVLGISPKVMSISTPAKLFRAGTTNAADRGLDMWANFGPAVQVKHLSLDEETAEDLMDQISADNIVIVCKDAHALPARNIMNQLGYGERLRGIITQSQLESWYEKALRGRFAAQMSSKLLRYLRSEFDNEFPAAKGLEGFLQERGYDKMEIEKWHESN